MQKKILDNAEALLAQREASVRFGRMALQSGDLGAVLTEACRLTGEALGTHLAKVMELQDDGRTLLVVAGVGWKEGVVGCERIPAVRSSSEGFALTTGTPAVSPDITEEDRFDYATFLVEHGVHAMINVIIPGPDGRPPYGLLQVDSREPREFSESDVEFLQSYANLVGAAIERHFYQHQLEGALRTKERLLAELQHRVKNSLSVIMSLLSLKAGRAAHPATKRDVSEIMQQVATLSELYDQLHASSKVDEVDLGGYLTAIASSVASFQAGESVRVESDHASVVVDPELAVNLGLVLNEFVTNSIKHAGGEALKIRTSLTRVGDGSLDISMADNGPGLGNALERQQDETTGSGLGLIEGLLDHNGCAWEWRSNGSTELRVKVPLAKKRGAAKR